MSSIRKFVYATLLALTSLNFAPTLASAQEPAQGKFKLPHDVHWQNAMVPAGDYQFSFQSNGPAGVLTLRKLSGKSAGFMLLVSDMEEAKPAELSRLVLQTSADGSYVSTMQLPESGLTLHFVMPPPTTEKEMARAVTASMASSR